MTSILMGLWAILTEHRLYLYVGAWGWGTTWMFWRTIYESQRAYDNGDLSAFAWVGFAPFIVPVMAAQVGVYVLIVAAIVEGIAFAWRLFHL